MNDRYRKIDDDIQQVEYLRPRIYRCLSLIVVTTKHARSTTECSRQISRMDDVRLPGSILRPLLLYVAAGDCCVKVRRNTSVDRWVLTHRECARSQSISQSICVSCSHLCSGVSRGRSQARLSFRSLRDALDHLAQSLSHLAMVMVEIWTTTTQETSAPKNKISRNASCTVCMQSNKKEPSVCS